MPADVPLVKASVLDAEIVRNTIIEHEVVGVVHLAGFKYAGVSVDKPFLTYEQNVTGTVRLLEAMQETGVDKMVFSSSAAIFGTPDVEIVDEQTPTAPESPYAESKLIGEWLMRDAERAHGLRHTSLRYFNVVGSAEPHLYDTSPAQPLPQGARQPRAGQDDRRSTVTTTRLPMAPACATTSTSPTSLRPTWPRLRPCPRVDELAAGLQPGQRPAASRFARS